MLIRCINRPFQDLAENVWRKVGDEWEAAPERISEINRAGYGVMAEAVPEEPTETPAEASETPEEPRKGAAPKKGTATRRTARKSAQEG